MSKHLAQAIDHVRSHRAHVNDAVRASAERWRNALSHERAQRASATLAPPLNPAPPTPTHERT